MWIRLSRNKIIELSKEIKIVVGDKAKYIDCPIRDYIKVGLHIDLIMLLDKESYPSNSTGNVYGEVLEETDNSKRYVK